jgi:hypothetical protein
MPGLGKIKNAVLRQAFWNVLRVLWRGYWWEVERKSWRKHWQIALQRISGVIGEKKGHHFA